MILDTHAEVFVWVGQSVDPKEKQNVFDIAQVPFQQIMLLSCLDFHTAYHSLFKFLQNFIDMAASLEGLSPKVPLYKVTEGNEPCFFTTFFSWDLAKATVRVSLTGLFFNLLLYNLKFFMLPTFSYFNLINTFGEQNSNRSPLLVYANWRRTQNNLYDKNFKLHNKIANALRI